ncbi:hypothetical protein RJ498_003159 [Pluralibacter gergoviae]
MHRFIVSLLIVSATAASSACAQEEQQCGGDVISAAGRWAGVSEKSHPVAAAACKAMPGASDTVIAAIAFDKDGLEAEEGGIKQQVIALVQHGKVVAGHSADITEDSMTGVGANSYRIDTAPYRLSPEVRAFGVIFNSSASGPSCPQYAAWDELTLWIREGETLKPVFGTNLSGWASLDDRFCNRLSESAKMTVAIEKTVHHGFADIRLVARVVKMEDRDGGVVETGKRVARKTFRYDGHSYGINMFTDFWYSEHEER